MIEPPLPISGSAFWTVKIVPFTLTSKVSSMCLAVISPSRSWLPTPALAKTMSRVPRSAFTAAYSRSRSARSETEPFTARALGPRSATAASSASCRRPKMKTKAPSSMKRFAAARPMPVAPPVITAVFPLSLVMSCILRWSCTEAGNCLLDDKQYSRVYVFGDGRELLGSPNLLSIRPKRGGAAGPDNRHLQNDARNRFRSAQARSHSPVGLDTEQADRRKGHACRQDFTHGFGALRHALARQLLAECGRD